jgi:hypothetical protein
MLRTTVVALGWRPKTLAQRVKPLLTGRAKVEAKLATRYTIALLRDETHGRLADRKFSSRNITRVNVDAASKEHGTDWAKLRNDASRQNVVLFPTALKAVAMYEPMSFRALCELLSSGIAPPPEASTNPKPQLSSREQLDLDIVSIQKSLSPSIEIDCQSWRRFGDARDARD